MKLEQQPLCVALLTIASCRDGCDDTPSHPREHPPTEPSRESPPIAPSAGHWRAALLPMIVNGALLTADVEQTAREHHRELDACGATIRSDAERVRVILRFAIGGNGRAGEINPVQPRPEAQSLRTCVTDAVREWQFPRSDTSASTVLMAVEFTPEAR